MTQLGLARTYTQTWDITLKKGLNQGLMCVKELHRWNGEKLTESTVIVLDFYVVKPSLTPTTSNYGYK